jgi:beta-lactamase superfamily II metal-dependent hydrolase
VWKFFVAGAALLIDYILEICRCMSKLRFLCIVNSYDLLKFVLIFIITSILGLAVWTVRKKFERAKNSDIGGWKDLYSERKNIIKFLGIIFLNMFIVFIFSNKIYTSKNTGISVLNCGDGFSAVISRGSSNILVLCTGTSHRFKHYALTNFLNKANICSLDMLILPRFDLNYYDVLCKITDVYTPKTVVVPERYDLEEKAKIINEITRTCEKRVLGQGFEMKLYEDTEMKIFRFGEKIWIHMKSNERDILFCPDGGDVSYIPEKFRKCSFFVSYGLPNNFYLLNILDTAIISCVKSDYPILEEKIQRHGIKNFFTSKSGNINIILRDSGENYLWEEKNA